ncbi:MAG: 16S rRNA (guanine(966)-N(2))-methyltransferase RsmD [Bacteroidota bacterium]|nr:16S rRNA (guanine(966)-N(2))-methyltransferase RsmD [Candidatus Kapabacteria bacterium]MDW8221081.1 16S rRNA (guanine(966)-N(2))-methyltransferase RsmD [Bacteroidota bacterium]
MPKNLRRMRITGGTLRGRILKTHGFQNIRPTTDRARETIYNIALNYCDFTDKSTLDLCAGTGALSFEALSRGGSLAVMVERNRHNCALLTEMAVLLQLQERVKILCADARNVFPQLALAQFHCVFADPPYAARMLTVLFSRLAQANICAPECLFIAEHDKNEVVRIPDGWEKLTERRFGDTVVEFFCLVGF